MFQVVRLSGTIKKVEQEAVRRARRMIVAVQEGRAEILPSVFGAEAEQGIGDVNMEDADTSDAD